MKGDFSRDTFDKAKHFSRVLMQQGRVQLDADWNEQTAILLHYLQALAADLIGPHGAPGKVDGSPGDGFLIRPQNSRLNFDILPDHYYVQGILCENEKELAYTDQPAFPFPDTEAPENGNKYLVYLDVWERHLTYREVESPDGSMISIREVALGGPDTATRAQVVWQVKLKRLTGIDHPDFKGKYQSFLKALEKEKRPGTGSLRARAKKAEESKDPCLTAPEARYRGPENQLYRVEIHKGGPAGTATFKWSRDNGSVTFPIRTLVGKEATLEHLGRDKCLELKKNDWVEIVDDHIVLRGEAGQLAQVDKIDMTELTVTLKVSEGASLPDYQENDTRHPLLRRWDQQSNAIPVSEGDPTQDNDWINLESGVQILFPKAEENPASQYRIGDYWLIPARTATGDVEWPGPAGSPTALPPHGVVHHYAPLAIISVVNGTISDSIDLRRKLRQFWD